MYGVIYKIKNNITQKCYIGKTVRPLIKRWREHCGKDSNCESLSRSIEKYGKENFTISVICKGNNNEEIQHREKLCISLYGTIVPNGYNMTSGGEGLGRITKKRTLSEETKQKLRIANLGKKHSEETKDKCRIASLKRKKYKVSDEAKAKMRAAKLGRKLSIDHIKKIGFANTGKIRTLEQRKKMSDARKRSLLNV